MRDQGARERVSEAGRKGDRQEEWRGGKRGAEEKKMELVMMAAKF